MSAADHRERVRRIVEAALPLTPEERRVLVEIECRDDDSGELRAEVERVLEGEVPTEMLMAPARERPGGAGDDREDRVGPYRIARLIGRGGMGAVYEGQQEHPHRRVAIKMISTAGASDEALRRFRMECEVLASLRHPGIARLLDAGEVVQRGMRIPWFAMEFVEGARPLDRYAREERLDVRARVALLLGFCDAIAYAHGRGVIHRDLKPANMLVDAAGVPRVIDFGIARAAREGGGPGVTTVDGQLLGTPIYMSPEQMDADPDAIDVRTDVYALGVVLYELLADRPPWNVAERSPIDALAILRRESPTPLPGTNDAVPRDLAAIVEKAMAPAKGDRYRSVDALVDDLQRHLDGRPVTARAHSRAYVVARTARRHWRAVASVVLLLVVVGVVGAERLRASWRLHATQERLAATTEWVTEVSSVLEDILQESDTFDRRMPEPRLLEVFERRVPEVYPEDSIELARARTLVGLGWLKLAQSAEIGGTSGATIVHAERSLALFAAAERTLSASLPAPDVRRAEAHHNIGRALFALGRVAEAESSYLESSDEWDRLASAGIATGERLLRGTPVDRTETTSHLAACRMRLGRLAEAEDMFVEVYRQRHVPGAERRRAAASNQNLANCFMARGNYREAIPLLESALVAAESSGFDASLIVRTRGALAQCAVAVGRAEAAAAAIDAFESVLRVVRPGDAGAREAILALRVEHALARGDLEEVVRLAAPVVRFEGDETRWRTAIRRAWARAYAEAGRAGEALPAIERLYEAVAEGEVGKEDGEPLASEALDVLAMLAFVRARGDNHAGAAVLVETVRRRAFDGDRPQFARTHPSLVLIERVAAELALAAGDRPEAHAKGALVVELLEASLEDPDDARVRRARDWSLRVGASLPDEERGQAAGGHS